MHMRKYPVCPFFYSKSDKARGNNIRITCETIKNLGFDVQNQLAFRTKEEMETYLDMFCTDMAFTMCPYYQAIYKKYEKCEEEEDE